MNKRQFWELIALSRQEARGDDRKQEKALEKRLRELPPREIVSFNKHFDEYRDRAYHWDLWGAVYVIRNGCGDDSFSDFRDWLISRGEEVYRAALREPNSLLMVVKPAQGRKRNIKPPLRFSNPAMFVWAELTGKDMFDMPSRNCVREEPAGEEWAEDGDDLRQRFPEIWEKFGNS